MYNEGISRTGDVLDLGVKEEIVQKSGSWFSYNDVRLGQGRENAKQFLKDNPELLYEIENTIREKYDLPIVKNNIKAEVEDKKEKKAEEV